MPEATSPADPLLPLSRWYQVTGQPEPVTEIIPAEAMPQPYRQLLVHERDMTSTLEAFHDGRLHLRVLGTRQKGAIYQREVVLQLDGSGWPVEFGATQINLDTLPAEAQKLILEGRRPFGGILRKCAISYTSRPRAYFRVQADPTIREAFRLAGDYVLYGRCNVISDREGRVIAEIVEILPPATGPAAGRPRAKPGGTSETYDAIVVGGGPAGATTAAVLAMKGRRVLVLEKEKFPRYHVGESLMPFCYFPLERIGVIDQIKASHFPKKHSVQFVRQSGDVSAPFYFFQHLKHEAAQTWQVLRSEFDLLLLDNARARGAEVIEEIEVRELIREDGAVTGVRAVDAAGRAREFRAPITVDATGRTAVALNQNNWRVRDPELNKMAVWTYYRGALRDPGLDEGATTVAYLPNKGWFWYIPLPDDMVSVGIVAERDYLFRDHPANGGKPDLEKIFLGEIENNVWIKQHLAPGRRVEPVRITSEFSYRSRHCAEDGLLLVGDAFAFLDPVFSSGVFLALRSGEMAADAIDAALTNGDYTAAQFAPYGAELCKGIEAMRRLVYAFYDEGFSFKDLIMKHPSQRGRLTDCLIGDVFGDFDALFAAAAEFARIPAPLPHGAPLVRSACALSK